MILKVNKDNCEIKENEIWNVGDYNVHTVNVELSSDFNGLVNKVRYFVEDNSYDMLITDNVAQVPYEATLTEGTIKIGVYGFDADTNILVQSTSPVNKFITSGTYTGEADNTEPLTPTDKQQMESAIQKNTDDITDLQNNKQDLLISGENIKTINNESILGTGNIEIDVGSINYNDLTNKPSINNVELSGNKSLNDLGIQPAGNYALESEIPDVSNFITKDVNNLTNYTLKTNTGSLIDLEINDTTYVVTLKLKNQDGTVISTDTIDLPLESVVVSGRYDNTTKKVILTLENGSEVDFSVADLVAGLQTELSSANKLNADYVDDTNSGNKFVTTSEKQTWNNKYDKPNGGIPKTDLASDVQTSLGKADTAIQSSDLTNYVTFDDYATTTTTGVVKTSAQYGVSTSSYTKNLTGAIRTYAQYQSGNDVTIICKGTLENVITGKNLETSNNKVTSISLSSTNTEYPSAKAVYDYIQSLNGDEVNY